MQSIKSVFERIESNTIPADGDYYDDEGYLMCGKCHTQKQCEIDLPDFIENAEQDKVHRLPVPCKCRLAEIEAENKQEERRRFKMQMEDLRRDGITDQAYLKYTFSQDDRFNPDVSDVCRKYTENWAEMKTDNIGILFYGDVGTGKTFLACCIANALLEQLVSVSVTNFPRILNRLQATFDDERQEIIDRMQRYSLLVIDDLGVERDTAYSVEQVFNVVDARARAKKPLIITTNLSLKDMQNPPTLAYKRVYDRVLEMCPIRLKLVGESRRAGIANNKRDKALKLLGFN